MMKKKRMLPPVGIEPGPLITSDSKSNTFLSTLTWHVLRRRSLNDFHVYLSVKHWKVTSRVRNKYIQQQIFLWTCSLDTELLSFPVFELIKIRSISHHPQYMRKALWFNWRENVHKTSSYCVQRQDASAQVAPFQLSTLIRLGRKWKNGSYLLRMMLHDFLLICFTEDMSI